MTNVTPTTTGDAPDGLYTIVNSLGRGFDIFGAYNMDALIPNRIFDWNKAATYESAPFLQAPRTLPSIVSLTPQTMTHSLDITATSRAEVQTKIATHAGVEASYGPFSGEFNLNFSQESDSRSSYFYGLKKAFIALGYINLDTNDAAYLANGFAKRVAELPDQATDATMRSFVEFFQDYGFYYVDRLDIGGELNLAISVKTESHLNTRDISSGMQLAYNGLFSGALKVDASFEEKWKTFSENSNVRVRAIGGKPDVADALAHIDPKNPNTDSRDLVQQWTQTLNYSPAVMNMHFSGIWKLCGSKRQVVEQAFKNFGVTMMPKVSLTSSPAGPRLMIGGKAISVEVGTDRCGFQLTVLNRRKVLDDDGVVHSKFYSYAADRRTPLPEKLKVYTQMLDDIRSLKLDNPGHIACLISYNMGHLTFPPRSFYQFLSEAGGGSEDGLKQWEKLSRSSGYNNPQEIAYCLLGVVQGGEGNGIESFAIDLPDIQTQATGNPPKVETSVSSYLIRSGVGEDYSISRDPG